MYKVIFTGETTAGKVDRLLEGKGNIKRNQMQDGNDGGVALYLEDERSLGSTTRELLSCT